jgi:hypothetical protein
MSLTPGTKLHGIRSIEDVRLRCRIDETTGCWIWGMAYRTYPDARRNPEPAVWLADLGICVNGKKAVAILGGRAPKKGQVSWSKCLNSRCVNPQHVKVGSYAERGAYLAKTNVLKGDPARSASNAKHRRARSAVTEELAAWIRESPQSGADVCHATGFSSSTVSRIRRGESWAENFSSAGSVFHWRPALKEAA